MTRQDFHDRLSRVEDGQIVRRAEGAEARVAAHVADAAPSRDPGRALRVFTSGKMFLRGFLFALAIGICMVIANLVPALKGGWFDTGLDQFYGEIGLILVLATLLGVLNAWLGDHGLPSLPLSLVPAPLSMLFLGLLVGWFAAGALNYGSEQLVSAPEEKPATWGDVWQAYFGGEEAEVAAEDDPPFWKFWE